MRIGQNPAKAGIKARQPLRIGIGIITYIPNQTGYFTEGLQITQLEIASLRHNTAEPFDLYVFDNGSCAEVQSELIRLNQSGVIDFLILSHHNIGKFGAMNELMAAMSNEWVVYTDSDFFFRKGWLEESFKLAEAYPEAGMITAQPNIYDQLEGQSQALKKINTSDLAVSQEKLDRAVVEEYCHGIGASPEMRQKFLGLDSTLLTRPSTGVRAVYGACTAQFMGKREVFQRIFPLPHEFVIAREEDNELTRRLDAAGWLEISTLQPWVMHMGNHLDETVLKEAADDGLGAQTIMVLNAPITHHKAGFAWKLLVALNRNSFFNKIFKRMYVNLFELYSFERK